jgi:hypothetical protein
LLIRRRTLLIRRPLLVLLRGSLLVRRTLLVLLRRLPLLIARVAGALALPLHLALLHLRASRTHLLAILVLLIAVELTHELAMEVAFGVAIARAALRVCLRILMDERLNALLLIAGKVEIAKTLRPAMLELTFTGHRPPVRLRRRGRALLRVDAERHCKH